MRKLLFLLIFFAAANLHAQTATRILSSPEPLPNCVPGGVGIFQPLIWDTTTSIMKYCSASNTWSSLPTTGMASTATGAPTVRTLSNREADTFNVLDNGALGTNSGTAIGTTFGANLAAFAGYTTATGATPFSWATNPLYGLTFSMAVSTNQATVGTPLTFTETLTDGTWTATVALWQDPAHGNYLLTPGMLVTGSCIAANTTVSSVSRTAGSGTYGQVTLNQNTSSTCSATTSITFTIPPAQLQALTLDWLGIQTATARADAANGGIGGEVDIPCGNYSLNYPILNATGNTQGIRMQGGGVTCTVLKASSDFGTDFCLVGEPSRNGGSSASSYRDFQLVAPTQSLTMGTSPNGMDGLCFGSNAKIDAVNTSYFHAGLNGIGNHWTARTITASNGGYGAYFAPYGNAAGVGNATITDSNLVGNTIASIASSTTNTIDSSTFTAVHTGFGPYGIFEETNPSTVTTPRALMSNSVLTNVYMEALGNAFIYTNSATVSGSYGLVRQNQFIGGGSDDIGGHSQYKIAANSAIQIVNATQFDYNTMIGTNWGNYANLLTSAILSNGECNFNTWVNDPNFILDGTTSVAAMSCGQGANEDRFLGPQGEGAFFANTGSTLSTAFLPLMDGGSGTVQGYTTGKPFAGINAAPSPQFTYIPVITYSSLVNPATKATTADTFTQGQFVYPITGGFNASNIGNGAIGSVFLTSSGGTATFAMRLDPMLGAAGTGPTANPTISSGFGSGATVTTTSGARSFRIGVGTSSANTGVIGLPTSATGWNCQATDVTTNSTSVFVTKQTASSASSVTLGNFNDVAGAGPWTNNDILAVQCDDYR